ncbi:MAG TPA: hypothetical protein VHG08_21075 [Longimicrobium sp.]|nr:hypothetical protein [Longimicrobium sp.]
MRKLKLELEDLAVQSFATDRARGLRGTAHAYATLPDDGGDTTIAPGDTEPGMNCFTCELSCGTRGC